MPSPQVHEVCMVTTATLKMGKLRHRDLLQDPIANKRWASDDVWPPGEGNTQP